MCDFFIFPLWCGTWDHVRTLGPELMECPRCHNNAIQTIRRRRWMTLYCIPVFPISRRRQLFHCDICRWEGIPLGTVQMRQEHGHHRHHHHLQREEEQHQSDSSTNRQNRDLYMPRSSSQGTSHTNNSISQTAPPTQSHFQSVPYSTNDYQAPPPPPYTKTPP